LRELGGNRGGEIAAHRLLSSDKVGVEEILEPHVARTAAAAQGRAVEDKKSVRWLDGATIAGTRLAEAAEVISVSDRESDIYPFFARKPEHLDLIIRAAQDRALSNGSSLFRAPAA
jgi:hypothetical protein